MKGKEGGLDSAEKCQKMCQITADCELFTYIVNKKECLLKKFDALLAWQIERKEGHISGSKFCNYGGYWIVVFLNQSANKNIINYLLHALNHMVDMTNFTLVMF